MPDSHQHPPSHQMSNAERLSADLIVSKMISGRRTTHRTVGQIEGSRTQASYTMDHTALPSPTSNLGSHVDEALHLAMKITVG